MNSKSKASVFGVGINDLQHLTEKREYVNGKYKLVWACPFYCKWKHMLERCYSEKHLNRYPTYKGCAVCEEWLTFSNFKKWMETQDWEGKALDKDLLVYQNKVYSPETCVFIPSNINTFLVYTKKGKYSLGVCWSKSSDKFQSQISVGGCRKYLGVFTTENEAHRSWQLAKMKQCEMLIEQEEKTSIVKGLLRVYDKLNQDYMFNNETVDL